MVDWPVKTLPDNIRQQILQTAGLPLFGDGRLIFCDPANGSDGHDGEHPDKAFATLAAAEDKGRDEKNDIVVLIGDGQTSGTARLSESLTWDKNALHLIGVTAGSYYAKRARISTPSGQATNINPLINHTSQGCIFKNFSFFQGVGQSSTDEELFHVNGGQRNLYEDIDFGGMGHATGAARAGSYVMQFTGGSENTIRRCTIGLDTALRGNAANASVRFRSGSKGNVFEKSRFPAHTSNTAMLFIDANASNAFNGGINEFYKCLFYALDNPSPGATPAVVAVVAADANGEVLLVNCAANNVSAWAAASARVKVNMGVPSDAEGGVMVDSAD